MNAARQLQDALPWSTLEEYSAALTLILAQNVMVLILESGCARAVANGGLRGLAGDFLFYFGADVLDGLVGGFGDGDAVAVVFFDEDDVECAEFEHAGEVAFSGAD